MGCQFDAIEPAVAQAVPDSALPAIVGHRLPKNAKKRQTNPAIFAKKQLSAACACPVKMTILPCLQPRSPGERGNLDLFVFGKDTTKDRASVEIAR